MFVALTKVQKQFHTIYQLYPKSTAYNISLLFKINGNIENDKFERTIDSIFQNNPVLSTTIGLHNGEPVFFPAAMNTPFSFSHESENDINQRLKKLVNIPFNLETEAPIRFFLLKVSSDVHYFLVIQHHIVTDLHSKNILVNAIAEGYNNGSLIQFNPQRNVDSQRSDTSDFWLKNMSQETLKLPHGASGRSSFSGNGGNVFWSCPHSVSKELKSLESKGIGASFLNLLTAYVRFLSRLSGQKEFNIAIPFTNRNSKTDSDSLGAYVNVLPLKAEVSEGESFDDLYRKLRKQMLFLHRVQSTPFLEISKFYTGKRDTRLPSILQAGFTQEPVPSLKLKNLDVESIPFYPEGSQMDLFFTYWPEGEGFSGRWEYNSSAFTFNQIYDWQDSFNFYLEQIFVDKNKDFGLPLVRFKNVFKLSNYKSNYNNKYPVDSPFAKLLLDAYKKYSQEDAISFGNESWSFAQFEDKVLRIASWINSRYGSGKHIAVSIPRSFDLLVALHGIVISGNVYVPIDPHWPEERFQYILKDSNASCLFMMNHDSSCDFGIPIHSVESSMSESLSRDIDVCSQPDDPIYLLYTSGSTGTPKGVLIPGNGLVNRLFWMQQKFPINPGSVLLQKTPFTFDVSVWELFWSFLFGSRLHVAKPGGHFDFPYLSQVLHKEKVSYIHFVPSMLRDFLKSGVSIPLGLTGIICSGEALDQGLYRELREQSNVSLFNLYGPTEASIDVTSWECTDKDLEHDSIPIGKAIENTGIIILDNWNNICPPYVLGEICISGIQLALSYWGKERLTAEVFQEININGESIRVYRTGDLGRYREDGTVEYLGRRDSQIKIKGVRIELMEIESVINNLPFIHQCAVKVEMSNDQDKILVAYVQYLKNLELKNELRKSLSKALPGFLIPSAFQKVEKFPMLTSGKIDKNQLVWKGPAILSVENESTDGYVSFVYNLWQNLLHIEKFSYNENFFDLGGHSFLLFEVKNQIEKQLKVSIAVSDLFKYTSVRELGEFLGRLSNQEMTFKDEIQPNKKRQQMGRLKPRNRR